MRSISSSNLRKCFRPPTAIVLNRPSNGQCILLGLLQENVEKGWMQDATLANSDSCLKPFKFNVLLLDTTALELLL